MTQRPPENAPNPHGPEVSEPITRGFWFSRARREARRTARSEAEEMRRLAVEAEMERIAQRGRDREAAARYEAQEPARQRVAYRKAEAVKAEQHQQMLEDRVRRLEQRLAPIGTPIEQALDAVLPMEGNPATDQPYYPYAEKPYDDSFRPVALRLARKFMRPDEQVLGAAEAMVRIQSTETRDGWKYRYAHFAIVVFTHGFAAKIKGREFRSDTKASFKVHKLGEWDWDHDGYGHSETASLTVGDLALEARSGASLIFTPLRLQAALQARPAPRRARSRGKNAPQRPQARLIRTARDAELIAAEWMTYLGFTQVIVTPVGADGGIDVSSAEAVAQVKAESKPTGRPNMQQHHGVAVANGKTAIFFSLAGFTPQARTYAEQNGLVLFGFNLQGEPEPINPAAHQLMSEAS
ncbi:restriction endonuclease [Rothia sp. ARF10]|nr:restriction endonuclease [Rothia sp. ARF10]